ncbi:hypothetical protein KIH86_13155 [Paenibacillus sp. HN-1]|uniref:hypothetical protein n=1 Tax=Paenibacillus TaxID=44249 RepID=UPI001CAA014A|nr:MULTISPECIES: hypothetical protein [Paenibacillus]MBY9080833.1 hypothetical protein [Paenibacillus sp. CGMCC 1.18879]MBY9085175.1 hypothetical protein [Paenibacillus sinensis]
MNHAGLGNMVSRLPIAMAGIVHAFGDNGRGLSLYANFITPAYCEMSFLPSCRRF